MLMTFLLSFPASLSLCCDTLNSDPLTIDAVPQDAVEGGSVLLQVHNLPEDLQTFSWFKGVQCTHVFKIAEYSIATKAISTGRAFSRRETAYTNGSLLLRDVTEKDSGFYTLVTTDSNLKVERAHVQVSVNSK